MSSCCELERTACRFAPARWQNTIWLSYLTARANLKDSLLPQFTKKDPSGSIFVNSRGLEPLTSSMSTKRSNQLSYEFLFTFSIPALFDVSAAGGLTN